MVEHAKKGNTVFFSSHILDVVEKICHRIAIINQGELKGVFSLEDIKKQGRTLEDIYLELTTPLNS
jgi:ABC-2 type transport system ATP-binding protein